MDTSDAGRKSQFEQRSQRPDEPLEWLDEQRRRWRLVMESHAVSLIGDEKTAAAVQRGGEEMRL